MKSPSSLSFQLDFLRRGILWHIVHGWCVPCSHRGLLVRVLGIEQLRQRLDRMASGCSTEFHSAHAKDIVSSTLFVARKTAQHHTHHFRH